jgi:hypothetical protein
VSISQPKEMRMTENKATYREIPKLVDPLTTPVLDPRLQNMERSDGGAVRRTLAPPQEPTAGSGYWIYECECVLRGRLDWENRHTPWDWGYGRGFSAFTDKPRFRSGSNKPKRRWCEFWPYLSAYIASAAVVDILRTFDADAIEAIEIDYTFAEGGVPDQQYYFCDIVRRYPGIDLANSFLDYSCSQGHLPYLARVGKASVAPAIPENFHVFRDMWSWTGSMLMFSDALAQALCRRKALGMGFRDPAHIYATLSSHKGRIRFGR